METLIDIDAIERIDVMYADGVTEQFKREPVRGDNDSIDFLTRFDNMYRGDFDNGLLDYVSAYDVDGAYINMRTADEFFGEGIGF